MFKISVNLPKVVVFYYGTKTYCQKKTKIQKLCCKRKIEDNIVRYQIYNAQTHIQIDTFFQNVKSNFFLITKRCITLCASKHYRFGFITIQE